MTAAIHRLPDRISIKAYSMNHQIEVTQGENRFSARLIDISSTGARIAIPRGEERRYGMGGPVGVNIRLTDKGVESGPIPAVVNWLQAGEIEVAFARPLAVGAHDLQVAVG